MWFRYGILLCCALACAWADVEKKLGVQDDAPVTFKPKTLPIKEYVTSHRIPEEVARPLDDDEDVIDVEKRTFAKENKSFKKVVPRFETFEKKYESVRRDLGPEYDEDPEVGSPKRQARVELENFGDTGILQEDGLRRADGSQKRYNVQRDSVIPGVYVSDEYPTTMVPILTTPREAKSFDFVPVNIIREDGKDAYSSFNDRHFDIGDVSLVPAGTNSRIQVKKGPNGKDYEYEYVYYYYDEEDESKAAGSSVTNTHDTPSRTTTSPRRGSTSNSNRSKYSSVERSSTVEPVSNEVIPNRNRGRQLAESETEAISEERLPTNTRFPPRSRSNHNTGTTEASRARGNRPRPSLDLVDSSSFRTHQEGPEFPQSLPKGPVRFLGVTPNEDNEEKPLRGRGRPQRVQEPAPVEETSDDVPPPSTTRRRPTNSQVPEAEIELSRGQPARPVLEEERAEEETPRPYYDVSRDRHGSTDRHGLEEYSGVASTSAVTTDNPTTEYPSAMDKVALDLYAFLQQGQSNLVDASSSSSESNEPSDATTQSNQDTTTDVETTTEIYGTTTDSTTTTTTTTTTTEPTTTTTTTTEPATTTTQLPAGRGKFRRPGVPGIIGTRNRFKSNGGSSTTESAVAEVTQRTRGRFGNGNGNGNGSPGFKRPRPSQKQQPVEEDTVQKESVGSVSAEKPAPGRNRFRGTGASRPVSTTSAPSAGNGVTSASGVVRPTFNKLNINRRRGRPTTPAPATSDDVQETSESAQSSSQEATSPTTPKPVRPRLPGPNVRPIVRPGARVSIRKPGQPTTTSSTLPPETPEAIPEEPAGEGTEEETHEAPVETSPPGRLTTSNPLNKLRNRNRLQVQPKTTTRLPVPLAPRRSPLLPRRKVTEAPVSTVTASQEETSEEETAETEVTEPTSAETSTAASTKHEETRGLSSLLAPRRRIAPRRPGQIVARE